MNGGDVADSSEDAVLASDQLSYKLKTYTSGCTDDTPSFLSGLAIQDLGYLVHFSKQAMDIDPKDESASKPDTSIDSIHGLLVEEPHRRSVEPSSANTKKEIHDGSWIMIMYQIEILVVPWAALAAVFTKEA
jgi:hypothetical protein